MSKCLYQILMQKLSKMGNKFSLNVCHSNRKPKLLTFNFIELKLCIYMGEHTDHFRKGMSFLLFSFRIKVWVKIWTQIKTRRKKWKSITTRLIWKVFFFQQTALACYVDPPRSSHSWRNERWKIGTFLMILGMCSWRMLNQIGGEWL